jgi:myosin heavy subunit
MFDGVTISVNNLTCFGSWQLQYGSCFQTMMIVFLYDSCASTFSYCQESPIKSISTDESDRFQKLKEAHAEELKRQSERMMAAVTKKKKAWLQKQTELTNTISSIEQSRRELKKDLYNQISTLENDKVRLIAKQSLLEKDNRQLDKENRQLEEKKDELIKEAEQSKDKENAKLKETIEQLRERDTELKKENGRLREKETELKKEIGQLREKDTAQKNEIGKWKEIKDKLVKEIENWKEKEAKLGKENGQLKADLQPEGTALKEKNAVLETENAQLKRLIETLETKNSKTEVDNRMLKKREKEWNEEKAELVKRIKGDSESDRMNSYKWPSGFETIWREFFHPYQHATTAPHVTSSLLELRRALQAMPDLSMRAMLTALSDWCDKELPLLMRVFGKLCHHQWRIESCKTLHTLTS